MVTINAFASPSVAGGTPSIDSFDPASNMLVLGAVSLQGQTYNNVHVTVSSYALTANTFSDCAANTALTTVGNTYQTVMQGSDQSASTTTTTVKGVTTFNGQSVLAVESDGLITAGSAAGVSTSLTYYEQVTPTAILSLGSVTTIKGLSVGTVSVTSAYSPAIQAPLNLALNTPTSQTINVTSTPNIGNISQAETLTYLGMESLTIPAGTFMTCKVRLDSSQNAGTPSSSTSWKVASGPYRGIVVKTLNNQTGVQTVATKVTSNGS